jgi:hypothetical protein
MVSMYMRKYLAHLLCSIVTTAYVVAVSTANIPLLESEVS